MIRAILFRGIGGFLLLIACAPSLMAAHPFHVCIGQMEWNADSRRWEVSLRLHPQDVEQAMTKMHGRSISFEDSNIAEHAVAYLQREFCLVRAPEALDRSQMLEALESSQSLPKSELVWVGMEAEKGWLWIHLEMIPPDETPNTHAWLVHRILLADIDRQENSVRIVKGKNKSSLQFKRGEEAQRFAITTEP